VIAPNERFAYDLLVLSVAVESHSLEDFGSFGVEVVAPASETIVEAIDSEADHGINEESNGSMVGNHIYIKLDDTDTFLVLAHLKQNSISVKQGDHVQEGMIVAEVGNSGNSSEPHLHIHHQRQNPAKTNMFMSEGGMQEQEGKSIPKGKVITPINKSYSSYRLKKRACLI
jgi:hypothetical protein